MNQPRVRSRVVRRSSAFHRAEVSKFFASLVASRVDVSGRRARARCAANAGRRTRRKPSFEGTGPSVRFIELRLVEYGDLKWVYVV